MTARTLVLLRHAKAETPGELLDFERRLTERGADDADAAGAWLAGQRLRPGLVICSPAARTRETWHGVAMALAKADPAAGTPEVRFEPGLYLGGRTEVIDLLRAVPDGVGTVLVIGHNPTMSEISVLLHPHARASSLPELKTAGLAVHSAPGAWAQTEPGAMPLVASHTARG